MNNIRKIDKEIDKINKQISTLEASKEEGYEGKIIELKTTRDNLLIERNNITNEATKELEVKIAELDSTHLATVMKNNNLSEDEAKVYLFNTIMSNNGLNLESFMQTIKIYKTYEIDTDNIEQFKKYLLKYKTIRDHIQEGLNELKLRHCDEIIDYEKVTKKINELIAQRSEYIEAEVGIQKIIDGITDIESDEIRRQLETAKTNYSTLDRKSTDLTIEILRLKKETGLRKLLHKKKISDKRAEAEQSLNNQERQKEKVEQCMSKIAERATTIITGLSDKEKEQIMKHALSLTFTKMNSIESRVKDSIETRNTDIYEYYRNYLKRKIFEYTHTIAELNTQREKHQPLINEITKAETRSIYFSDMISLSLEDKVSYEVIRKEYPFVDDMTDEEIDAVIHTDIEPSTMCLSNYKAKTKSIERN